MLLIDRREKASDLVCRIQRLGCDAEYATLDYGDCCFEGQGVEEDGETPTLVTIGIERKRVSDLVNSIEQRRLAGYQLRGMRQIYQHIFLVVEGRWRAGKTGLLEVCKYGNQFYPHTVGRTPVPYRLIRSHLTTLELIGGVVVRQTEDVDETAAQYVALYKWFNDKAWARHTSLDVIHTNTPDFGPSQRGKRGRLPQERKITRLEMIAAQLPGIDTKARDVAKHFGSVKAMVDADEKAWRKVKGVGKVTAKEVVRALTEAGA